MKAEKFGCTKCGQAMEAYPPDSEYTILLSKPCGQGDPKMIELICDNCSTSNVRYWDRRHFFAGTVSG